MIKKLLLQLAFFSILFSKKVFAAESQGMPQLNPEFWISQIFWLTLTFGILYVILSKFILPRISANLESRKTQISDNIEAADKQRAESELKLKEYDKIISKTKIEAKSIFNQEKQKVIKDISIKKDALNKQIDEEIKKVEKEINHLRKDAPSKINKIAIDTSADLIQKLIGIEVNNSSISAIVDDLFKKNKEKYYGN